jgi:phytoene synthase
LNLEQDYAHCSERARAFDRDRWLGALFAPAPARWHLHALIAFEAELDGLRAATRTPAAGEIRLVWWREALAHQRDGEAKGHPVAAAMLDTLDRFRPPPHLVENAVAARQFDLYDDPFATTADLEGYLGETRSGLLQIAAIALGEGRDLGSAESSGLAGVALGLVDLLLGLSRARPLNFAPADLLARHGETAEDFLAGRAPTTRAELIAWTRRRANEAEAARRGLPKPLAPAYAGLATAPLRLDAIAHGAAPPAAWRRQWALWRWSRRS